MMVKGGARAVSGPPPDPNALRRERDGGGEWRVLPSEGRGGSAPVWPLDEPSERELLLWGGEWVRPQAVEWERNGQEVEVALYVRSLVAAEQRDASTAARTLVRQQQEALGLSQPGMLRLRWRIDVAEERTVRQRSVVSSRKKFQVVKDDDGA